MIYSRRDALSGIAALLAAVVLRPRTLSALVAKPFEHPDPRPGITGDKVYSGDKLAKKKQAVKDVFDAARAYPELFDGIYCACECKGSMGHRSLLSCFETDQPLGCGACREEGELVARLAKEGKTLAEIRQAVDKEYG